MGDEGKLGSEGRAKRIRTLLTSLAFVLLNYIPVEAGDTCDPLPNWTMFSTRDTRWRLTVRVVFFFFSSLNCGQKVFAHPHFYDIIKHDDSPSKLPSVDSQSEAMTALCQFVTRPVVCIFAGIKIALQDLPNCGSNVRYRNCISAKKRLRHICSPNGV